MSQLHKTAKQAQRRLWLNRWLGKLGWSVAVAAGLFILTVVIERVWIAAEETGLFYRILAASLAGAAFVTSLIWTGITRENLTTAAAQLDVAAGLKERISTGLHCQESSDPFAQAVVTDAEHISRGISVRQHLSIRVPYSANYAGGTLLAALLIFWLMPPLDLAGKQEQRQRTERVTRAQVIVKKTLDEQLKKIGEQNPDLKKEIDKPIKADLQTPLDVRRQAIKKVEKLSQQLRQKRKADKLAMANEFKKMMRRLATQQHSKSPVGELAKALSKGDYKSAQKAIEELKKLLAKEPKTEELKAQLKKLAARLDELAKDDKKLRKELADAGLSEKEIKKALENLKKNPEAVKKLLAAKGLSQKQIDKLTKSMKKRSAASDAAGKLGQNVGSAAGMEGIDGDLAGLDMAGDQLSELQALEMELNQLDASLAELDELKNQIGKGCSACRGTGKVGNKSCSTCQGSGVGPGIGSGRGNSGIVSKPVTDYKTAKRRTKTPMQRGRIISQQFVDGEQYKGEVSDEFAEVIISAQREAADADTRQPVPRIYHRSIAEYFDHASRDLPAEKVKAAENKLDEQKP